MGSDTNIELEHKVLAGSNFLIQNKLLREPTKVPGKYSVSYKTVCGLKCEGARTTMILFPLKSMWLLE